MLWLSNYKYVKIRMHPFPDTKWWHTPLEQTSFFFKEINSFRGLHYETKIHYHSGIISLPRCHSLQQDWIRQNPCGNQLFWEEIWHVWCLTRGPPFWWTTLPSKSSGPKATFCGSKKKAHCNVRWKGLVIAFVVKRNKKKMSLLIKKKRCAHFMDEKKSPRKEHCSE